MSMIRLQNSVPQEYPSQSRDFQLLCRLYDTIFNGIQFDISTITSILDTTQCRDSILPLLQTKLGLFINKEVDNYSLRYFLDVFPLLVRNKGTAKAIQQTIVTFLKVNNIVSPITIYYTTQSISLDNQYVVPDHTILIGINSSLQDSSLLDEVFKYILPAGIGYYLYYYTDIKVINQIITEDNAILLYVSDNINSQLHGNNPAYSNEHANRVVGAVDTANIAGLDTIIPTVNGTYEPNDTSLYLGQYEGEDPFNTFIQTLGITPINGNIILYNEEEYIYRTNAWIKVVFYGTVNSLAEVTLPQTNQIIYSAEDAQYYIWSGSAWINNTYALFIFFSMNNEEV